MWCIGLFYWCKLLIFLLANVELNLFYFVQNGCFVISLPNYWYLHCHYLLSFPFLIDNVTILSLQGKHLQILINLLHSQPPLPFQSINKRTNLLLFINLIKLCKPIRQFQYILTIYTLPNILLMFLTHNMHIIVDEMLTTHITKCVMITRSRKL